MKPKLAWTAFLLVALVLLAGFSTYLSLTRIYQVDECQNLYMAKVFAAGQASEFSTTSSLFLFGPLSWISQTQLRSAGMFTIARFVFFGVFWINMLLLAKIVGGRLSSTRGLIALVAAASLAPLWDYGLEIRHDNLVLTGVLLVWWAVRVKPMGWFSYSVAGAVTVILLLTAVKTVVYALPLSFAILAFPPPSFKCPRWQLAVAWLGGALVATVIILGCYGSGGGLENYLSVFRGVTKYSTPGQAGSGSSRFWPWNTLGRLLGQTPLLLAMAVSACLAVAIDATRRGKAALTWEGSLPEVLLLFGAFAALFANPTPFPYNLVHFVPYAFVLSFKYGDTLWNALRDFESFWPLTATVLVFVHLAPFCLATQRHLNWSNSRQELLMRAAEDLTDPAKDLVYDGIGMVTTRRSIHYQWYLHSLSIRKVVSTPGRRVRDMLAARPAAVFIPSYRTDWLPEEDHDFILRRYVPLADDFWVLGTTLPRGGGSFEIFHPGRYLITKLKPPQPSSSYQVETEKTVRREQDGLVAGTLDGATIPNGPVELSAGDHRIETADDCQPAIVWVGPHLDNLPHVVPGSHLDLFLNWY